MLPGLVRAREGRATGGGEYGERRRTKVMATALVVGSVQLE
jgi:hypothetical protein